ncbi:MAG TPA: LptA/OstA family protein, partial [Stellaceae bacterium]|nr:LptA/OstA family protein [Stellaceae bacterium]
WRGAGRRPLTASSAMTAEALTARRRQVAFWLAALWLAAAVGMVSFGAHGQGLTLGGGADKQPIAISAASGIEWRQDARMYIARGHAVAKRGAEEVDADTLLARYRQQKGGSEIYRVDADGNVVVRGPTQTIIGDHAAYDADQQVAVITGRHLKLTTSTDTVTARDSLEWYEQKQIAVARGDAVAVRGDKRIRADVLTAYLSRDDSAPAAGQAARKARAAPEDIGAETSRIERIDAQGNVIVSTDTDVGRGDYGVYNAKTGIVTLLGNVTITRGEDAIRGQYAVVDLNQNVSRMMSLPTRVGGPAPRVEGIFVRQGGTPAAAPVHHDGRRR